MKKIISILIPILAFIFLVGGTYYYFTSGNKNFKEEYSKYISLINDSHDFNSGLKGLETLTTEKAKETLRNIDNDIDIATELVKVDEAGGQIYGTKKRSSSYATSRRTRYEASSIN